MAALGSIINNCPTPFTAVIYPVLFYSVLMGPKSAAEAKKKFSKNTKLAPEAPSVPKAPSPITLDKSGNIQIKVHAKPGAKSNSITGVNEEGVGVQINAPPVDGEANTELVKFLSKLFGLRKSDVTLEKGSKSRHKTISINKGACSIDDVQKKLHEESKKQ